MHQTADLDHPRIPQERGHPLWPAQVSILPALYSALYFIIQSLANSSYECTCLAPSSSFSLPFLPLSLSPAAAPSPRFAVRVSQLDITMIVRIPHSWQADLRWLSHHPSRPRFRKCPCAQPLLDFFKTHPMVDHSRRTCDSPAEKSTSLTWIHLSCVSFHVPTPHGHLLSPRSLEKATLHILHALADSVPWDPELKHTQPTFEIVNHGMKEKRAIV